VLHDRRLVVGQGQQRGALPRRHRNSSWHPLASKNLLPFGMILKEDYERQEAAEIRHCRADLRIRPFLKGATAKAPYLIGYARVSG
jgi:hypothetical protein